MTRKKQRDDYQQQHDYQRNHGAQDIIICQNIFCFFHVGDYNCFMTKNQAFEIWARIGDAHVARILVENTKNFSWYNVWKISRALRRGVPVAKIIGFKWFYGLKFHTNTHTLDPRPDTETLVEAVISGHAMRAPYILDLGTGTGCIICALCKNIPNSRGVAIEISRRALKVAQKNIQDLGLGRYINVKRGDFSRRISVSKKFDVIVSNPPYIARGDERVDRGARHDPGRALYATHNGFGAYESIAKNARDWVRDSGRIYVEIGDGMDVDVREIFAKNGWKFVRDARDLSGIIRVLVFEK